MERFASTAQQIAQDPAKLRKIALLAQYFRTLDDADLAASARFFTGTSSGPDGRALSLGGRTIVDVARRIYGFGDAELGERYRESGDLGVAVGALVRAPADEMLFRDDLTPARLEELFGEISTSAGKNANKRRAAILERVLRACRDSSSATYVIKLITGDLRVGLRAGLVLEAIGTAFNAEPAAVRRAAMAASEVGAVAVAAKHRRLSELLPRYGTPVGFMLATPMPYGDTYPELAADAWVVEDKYDGIRAQAHLREGEVRLFSRRLNDVSASYPDVIRSLGAIQRNAILDGEIVAMRDDRILPFRLLQGRLQRKNVDASMLIEVPLVYLAFDLLALDDELLIDLPLSTRRRRLDDLLQTSGVAALAPFEQLAGTDAPTINGRFAGARARGNEGLMFKRADGPYLPGRRGKWWLKLKRELSTLDVVVVAVEWGNGKRAGVLSDYTFAVRGDSGELQTIGKAYSGLTDAEIAELTPWFLSHRLPLGRQREKARVHEIPVEPQIVLEVAFDIIQESGLHESGFALRFPRIVRIRDDKPSSEIDTLQRVREIYREMLGREGLEQGDAIVTPRRD